MWWYHLKSNRRPCFVSAVTPFRGNVSRRSWDRPTEARHGGVSRNPLCLRVGHPGQRRRAPGRCLRGRRTARTRAVSTARGWKKGGRWGCVCAPATCPAAGDRWDRPAKRHPGSKWQIPWDPVLSGECLRTRHDTFRVGRDPEPDPPRRGAPGARSRVALLWLHSVARVDGGSPHGWSYPLKPHGGARVGPSTLPWEPQPGSWDCPQESPPDRGNPVGRHPTTSTRQPNPSMWAAVCLKAARAIVGLGKSCRRLRASALPVRRG